MMQTNFADIVFNEKYHSYTYQGQRLTSVSKTIAPLKPTTDWDAKAQKAADERGVDVEVVKAEWEANRQKAMARGSKVHEWIAKRLTDRLPAFPDPFLALNERLPEMDAFERFWTERPGAGNPAMWVEWVVGDADLGIAGTVDAVVNTGDDLHLFDWKTGKAFTTENRFSRLLPPFNDLDDCELASYSLQLSLYRLIVERNSDMVLGDSYIVHLDGDGGYTVHKAMDLRGRLEEWLRVK